MGLLVLYSYITDNVLSYSYTGGKTGAGSNYDGNIYFYVDVRLLI